MYKLFLFFLTAVPYVNIPQTSYSVTYGGTVTLGCVVNSNPFQNRVEWERIANGVSTTLNVTAEPRYSGGSINTPSLTITGAVSGDAGAYVCSATNDAGKGVSGQTVLSVQGGEYRKWFRNGVKSHRFMGIFFLIIRYLVIFFKYLMPFVFPFIRAHHDRLIHMTYVLSSIFCECIYMHICRGH